MISCIVFSRNRPLQLDLCLKSIKKNLPLVNNICVIAKYDDEYKDALDELEEEHTDVIIFRQIDLLLDHIKQIVNWSGDYIAFMTDDDMVYRPLTWSPEEFKAAIDAGIVHLRLGKNITHRDYGPIMPQVGYGPQLSVQPNLKQVNNMFVWDRRDVAEGEYFNYPSSVDGNIFHKNDLQVMLKWISVRQPINTPNHFESGLQYFTHLVPNICSCPLESVVVNSPNNRVQSEFKNKSGESYALDPMLLNKVYLKGKRINLDKLDFSNIVCPHTELDILKGLE